MKFKTILARQKPSRKWDCEEIDAAYDHQDQFRLQLTLPHHCLWLRRWERDDKSTPSRLIFAVLPAFRLISYPILKYKTSNDCFFESTYDWQTNTKIFLLPNSSRVVIPFSQVSPRWGPPPRSYRRVFASWNLESPASYLVLFRGSSTFSIRATALRIHDWSSPYQWLPSVSCSLASLFRPWSTRFTASHWISLCLSAG